MIVVSVSFFCLRPPPFLLGVDLFLRGKQKTNPTKVTALTCQEFVSSAPENVKEFNDGCVSWERERFAREAEKETGFSY